MWPLSNNTLFPYYSFRRLQTIPEIHERLQSQFYKVVQMKGKPQPIPVWLLSRKRHNTFLKGAQRWKRFGAGSEKCEHLPTVRISSGVTFQEKPDIFQTKFAKSNGSSVGCTQTKSCFCTLFWNQSSGPTAWPYCFRHMLGWSFRFTHLPGWALKTNLGYTRSCCELELLS